MVTIQEVLSRGVSEIIDPVSLEKKLSGGSKLKVKLGIDPTTPHLHLGHSVVLRKLAQFQELGHEIILVIGDFTAQVGDPSGRDIQRPVLTNTDIAQNWATYKEQAGKILDLDQTKVVNNSSWLGKLGVTGILELASKATLNQILKRKEFQKRLDQEIDITFLEMLYPLLQAYDSVVLKADVELGGTDQKFNLLMGRQIQKRYGVAEQDIVMTPLLVGMDGKDKMSKSLGNYIGLTEDPKTMYGKIMSVPDDLLENYYLLCTPTQGEDIKQILAEGPYLAKKKLAETIVSLYHNKEKASLAAQEFNRVFREKEIPSQIPEISLSPEPIDLTTLVTATKLVTSRSEARRLITVRAVEVNGKIVINPEEEIKIQSGMTIKVGKHRFVKLKI